MSTSCCIGNILKEECNLNSHSDKVKKFGDLSKKVTDLLKLRIPGLLGLDVLSEELICHKHYQSYISLYELRLKQCCDPFGNHVKGIKSSLRKIELEFSITTKKACGIDIIPGQKICTNCYNCLSKTIKDFEIKIATCADPLERHRNNTINKNLLDPEECIKIYLNTVLNIKLTDGQKLCEICVMNLKAQINELKQKIDSEERMQSIVKTKPPSMSEESPLLSENAFESGSSDFTTLSQNKRKLNSLLELLDIQEFKRQKLNEDLTVKKGLDILNTVVMKVTNMYETATDIQLPKIENLDTLKRESYWFRSMINDLQTKFASLTSTNDKIALLTTLPDDWTFMQFKKYFDCTRYMFHEAKKSKKLYGSCN